MISLQDFFTRGHGRKNNPVPRNCVFLEWCTVAGVLLIFWGDQPVHSPFIYLADKMIHVFLINQGQIKWPPWFTWVENGSSSWPAKPPAPLHHPARDHSVLISHSWRKEFFSSLETFCKVTIMSSPDVQPRENRTDIAPGFLCLKCCLHATLLSISLNYFMQTVLQKWHEWFII